MPSQRYVNGNQHAARAWSTRHGGVCRHQRSIACSKRQFTSGQRQASALRDTKWAAALPDGGNRWQRGRVIRVTKCEENQTDGEDKKQGGKKTSKSTKQMEKWKWKQKERCYVKMASAGYSDLLHPEICRCCYPFSTRPPSDGDLTPLWGCIQTATALLCQLVVMLPNMKSFHRQLTIIHLF